MWWKRRRLSWMHTGDQPNINSFSSLKNTFIHLVTYNYLLLYFKVGSQQVFWIPNFEMKIVSIDIQIFLLSISLGQKTSHLAPGKFLRWGEDKQPQVYRVCFYLVLNIQQTITALKLIYLKMTVKLVKNTDGKLRTNDVDLVTLFSIYVTENFCPLAVEKEFWVICKHSSLF